MPQRNRVSIVSGWLILCVLTVSPATAAEDPPKWGFDAFLGWSLRQIDGTMFTLEPPLGGAATTDSLDLGSSSEPQASIGLRFRRLHVDFVYLPSRFEGDGFIVQELDFGSGPVIGTTDPVTSDIKVRMTLANVEFDLLKRIDMDWGIGVGLGQVGLDITMTPEVGDSVDISGDVPFGYLTSTFTKRWDRIEFRFGLQGLSISENETSVAYKSANIAGSYRILKRKRLGLDIAVGYRYVNFDYDFDDDATGARAGTDFTLVGPYGGLGVAW